VPGRNIFPPGWQEPLHRRTLSNVIEAVFFRRQELHLEPKGQNLCLGFGGHSLKVHTGLMSVNRIPDPIRFHRALGEACTRTQDNHMRASARNGSIFLSTLAFKDWLAVFLPPARAVAIERSNGKGTWRGLLRQR